MRARWRLCTIAEIAQVHDISEAHLVTITRQLALAGFMCELDCHTRAGIREPWAPTAALPVVARPASRL